ncbi:MAG: peptidylprolyl isomerase [Xanthomonadales bacterium]|nr:peptidylprolyl isomerase [Xanthomonadales bacterium]MBP7622380.1 peptidylprolyl isomerase [Xanthomonadales bacterium]
MKRILLATVFVLSAVGPITLRAQALPSDALDKIVAVVDEDVILQSELDRSTDSVFKQYQSRGGDLPPIDIVRKQVLERLINQRVQMVRAEQTGIVVSDSDIDSAVQRIAQQNNLDVEQMRQSLIRDGFSFEEFRTSLREEMLIQRLRARFVQSRVGVTDTEVDNFLSNTTQSGEIRLAHILIGLPESPSPEQVEAARAKADKIRADIVAGTLSFSDAAIRYSETPQALEGGDLGWRRYDQIPSAFAEIVTTMKKGDISQPMRGPNGFHMIHFADARADATVMVKEFKARHIVIKPGELLSEDKARERIDALRKRIVEGADFAQLARQYSEDTTTANLGGDLGWFRSEQYGGAIDRQMAVLKDGELSEPFRTDLGWHIVLREGERTMDRTTETRREQARETLVNRKAEEEYDKFVREIRSEAYIENRLAG